MRDYKFRGKRIDNGEWVVGNYLQRHDSFGALALIEVQDMEDFEINTYQVYPESVGQFTGLKDKNGKEIYAGDILRGFQKEQSDKEGKNGFDITDTVYLYAGGFKIFGKPMQDGYTRDNNVLYQFMWCNPGHFKTPDYYYQIDDILIIDNVHDKVKSAVKDSVTNTMYNNFDPNAKAEETQQEATQEQATEQTQTEPVLEAEKGEE